MSFRLAAYSFTLAVILWPGAPRAQSATAIPDSIGVESVLRTSESFHTGHRFLRTAAEVEGVNIFLTLYNRYVLRSGPEIAEFQISFDSVKENVQNGFEWDDNNFKTNHFMHPYHGSLYFNAARSNGYDFYESIPFCFAGSFLWEYTGETNHASINDWINTSLGGASVGEALYRISNMVLDNEARGSERWWREIGGFFINPMRGLNRMLTGEWTAVHANPPDRRPQHLYGSVRAGIRTIGDTSVFKDSSTRAFIALYGTFGDPFQEDMEKPFDHFDGWFQLNFGKQEGDSDTIGLMGSRGWLYGKDVYRSERARHILAAYYLFDYYDNESYTFGSQSVAASLLSRFVTTEDVEVRTSLYTKLIILGATKDDYFNISGRQYDYGPGVGVTLEGMLRYHDRDLLSLMQNISVIQSINGNDATHRITMSGAKVSVPLPRLFSLGIEYLYYDAVRDYVDYPDVHEQNAEVRISAMWGSR